MNRRDALCLVDTSVSGLAISAIPESSRAAGERAALEQFDTLLNGFHVNKKAPHEQVETSHHCMRLSLDQREAVMLQRRNIACWDVLQALAEEVAEQEPECFDADRFADDLGGETTAWAFRDDLMQARYLQIGRFPALIVTPRGGRSALLVGYRPYAVLRQTLEEMTRQPAPLFAEPGD
jgi:predicted DsbA family dithiol-disulfide isomerase